MTYPTDAVTDAKCVLNEFQRAEAVLCDYADTLIPEWNELVLKGLRTNHLAQSAAHDHIRTSIRYNASLTSDGVLYENTDYKYAVLMPWDFLDPETREAASRRVLEAIAASA